MSAREISGYLVLGSLEVLQRRWPQSPPRQAAVASWRHRETFVSVFEQMAWADDATLRNKLANVGCKEEDLPALQRYDLLIGHTEVGSAALAS